MDSNNISYDNNKIVSVYSEEELDNQIARIAAKIAKLQANLTNLQAVKTSIV